eukprot:scaffold449_cov241-Pinguiococcus_pyrenoidosus.AAC.8
MKLASGAPDPECLRTFEDAGIGAFLQPPSLVLPAGIKLHPEDFQVRELGPHGEGPADVRGSPEPPLVPPLQPEGVESAKERPPAAKKRRLSLPDPAEMLGDELLRRLEAVQGGQEVSASFGSGVLPALATKRGRARLLAALRNAFPLLSFANKKEKEELVEYEATVAAEVAELRRLFGLLPVVNLAVMRAEGPEEDPRAAAELPLAADGLDKAARRDIHRLLAKLDKRLETSFVSASESGNESSVIRCSWKRHVRQRSQAPGKKSCCVLRFCMRKRNVEATRAVQVLAEALRIHSSQFDAAGVKDKAAVTYQYMTVRLPAKNALQLARQLVRVGRRGAPPAIEGASVLVDHPEWVEKALSRGQNSGNAFRIVVHPDDPACAAKHFGELSRRANDVAAHGFVNYFGTQRVGVPTCASPDCAARSGRQNPVQTCFIGRALCQGDLLRAVDLILCGQLGLSDRACQDVEGYAYTKGNGKAREDGKDSSSEEDFGRALWVKKRDVEGALRFLPQHCHKERALLKGVQRHGVADLAAAFGALGHDAATFYIHAYQSLVFNLAATKRIELCPDECLPGDLLASEDDERSVEVLTTERCAAINSSGEKPSALSRVCLPLVGANVQMPENEVGEFMRRILRDHGTTSILESGHRLVSGRLRGGYRKLVCQPRAMRLDDPPGSRGLAFSFELPPGSFATVCLREILGSYPSG